MLPVTPVAIRSSDHQPRMNDREFLDAAALAALPCLVAASPDLAARRAFEIAEAMLVERHLRDGAICKRERCDR
jgi:hypothetical protein